MKKLYTFYLSFLFASSFSVVQAITITSVQSGPWTDANTWDCACIPTATDDVIVAAGHNVSISGTATVDASLVVNGTVTLSGALTGAGSMTYASGSTLNIISGNLAGIGTHTIASGATVNASSPYTTGAVSNHGTFNWNDGPFNQYCCGTGAFTNEADGTFNVGTPSPQTVYSTTFTNLGQFNKASANTTTFGIYNGQACSFTNSATGAINLSAGGILDFQCATTLGGSVALEGTLRLNAATTIPAAGVALSGNGILHVGSELMVAASQSFSVPTVNLYGTIYGAGATTFPSGTTLNMFGGNLGGTHTIASGATVNASSPYTTGTVSNHGTFNWNDGPFNQYCCGTGEFTNEADGTFNIGTPSPQTVYSTTFTNIGQFNKASANTTTFGIYNGQACSFTNSATGAINLSAGGILDFQCATTLSGSVALEGTLRLNAATTIPAAGVALSGNGILHVGSELMVAASQSFSVPTVNLYGTIHGAGATTFPSGTTLNMFGGNLGGTHTIASGATVNASSPYTTGTVSNHGTFNWNDGPFNQYCCGTGAFTNEADGTFNVGTPNPQTVYSTTFTNLGVMEKTTAVVTTFGIYNGQTCNFSNENSGTITGRGIYEFLVPFLNSGTISPGQGVGGMSINQPILPNGTLNIEIESNAGPGAGWDLLSVIGNFTAGGTLNVSLLGGYDPAPGTSFQIVSATGPVSGTFTALNLPGGLNDWSVTYEYSSINLTRILPPPACTNLISPLNGATNVLVSTNLTWAAAANATGYRLDVGTTSGGTDILNNEDVGNVTTFDLPANLPFDAIIYVDITPYNASGDAEGCMEESFTTAAQCPTGDVALSSQAEVDAFVAMYPNCTIISGNLLIGNNTTPDQTDINNITGLDDLVTITGDLQIYHTNLISLSGLNGLDEIGGGIYIFVNPLLANVNEIENISTVGTSVSLYSNAALSNINGFNGLTSVPDFRLDFLQNLTSLSGLHALTTVDYLTIRNCPISSISGFGNSGLNINEKLWISDIDFPNFNGFEFNSIKSIDLEYCNSITTLSGLENLTNLQDRLLLLNNPSLSTLSGLENLHTLAGLVIQDNLSLSDISSLSGVSSEISYFSISGNPVLTSLAGLNNVQFVQHPDNNYYFTVNSNPNLSICDVQSVCEYLEDPLHTATISGNAPGCATRTEVEAACEPPTWYEDSDNDGFGNPSVSLVSGTQPPGYVSDNTDCNDGNSAVHPGATEVCNDIDDDCDGQADEGVQLTFYADSDGDGFGDATQTTMSCTAPSGFVDNDDDCDDTDENVNPNATEVCNDIDDDCDGQVDEGVQLTFYADSDGDGFGDATQTTMACTAPSGFVDNDDDCDDTDENVNPNATEVCNDIDDDCDGQVDETTLGLSLAAGTIACAGGSTTLTATGSGGQPPYQYSLQSGPFAAQNMFTVMAGSYNVAVKDAYNCLVISSLTVNEPLPLTIPSVNVTHVKCAGGNTGAVDISVAGGTAPYSYQWSNNRVTQDIQLLAAGTYSVIVTDAHGCTATTAAIVNPKLKLVTSKTNVSCSGSSNGTATATVSGGTPPYSILWSNGEYTPTITGLAAGSYTVTVIDGYDCLRTATINISQPAAIAVSGLRSNVSCFGFNDGEIDLAVSNGLQPFTYNWSDGATTEDRSDLTAGTYVVTVTDNSGCSGTKSFVITQPTQLAINFAVVNVSCNGSGTGRITLSVTGGTRYTASNLCNGELYCYTWSNGLTSRIIDNLVAGTYNVTVTDKNGCVIFGSYTVTEPPILEITSIQQELLSNGKYKLTVTAAGGTIPYKYMRIPGSTSFQTSNIFNNVPAGTYQIVVRDNKLCTDTVEISVPGSSFLLAPSGAGTWSEIASEPADAVADPSFQINSGTENSAVVKGIRLFPNPAVKDVKLWVEKSFKEGEVLVFDVQGRLLIRQDLDANGVISLDVSPLKSGLYLVKVRLDGEYVTERLVITRN